MSTVSKDFEEVELPSGKVVNLTITVTGTHEANYGADADGNRGVSKWLIDSFTHEVTSDEDELDHEDHDQIAEKVEEMVYEEDWDFEAADDEDEDDEDEFVPF